MDWIVKLQRNRGQYRITLPDQLLEEVGYKNVEIVRLKRFAAGGILIEEYYGKRKEKRDIQEDKY